MRHTGDIHRLIVHTPVKMLEGFGMANAAAIWRARSLRKLKKYHFIACLQQLQLGQDYRQDKFIGNTVVVALLNGLCRRLSMWSTASIDNCLPGSFYTVPTLITIHSVITATNRTDMSTAFGEQSL